MQCKASEPCATSPVIGQSYSRRVAVKKNPPVHVKLRAERWHRVPKWERQGLATVATSSVGAPLLGEGDFRGAWARAATSFRGGHIGVTRHARRNAG